MDPISYSVMMLGPVTQERRFESPEWRHRVALEAARKAAREPWRLRFARRMRRLRLLASEPWPAWELRGPF